MTATDSATNAATGAPAAPRPKGADRALAGWLWRGYIRRWMPLIALGMGLMAIEGAMTGALSALLRPMFDDVLVAGRGDRVLFVAVAISGTFVVRALTSLLHRTLMAHISNKVIAEMQLALTSHAMRLDQSFHHAHPPGHLIDRVRGDTQELALLFDRIVPGFARDAITIMVLVGVALYTNVQWTLIALIGVPLLLLPAVFVQRLVRKVGVQAREASASASTRLDEVFHGVMTLQRTGLEAREGERLRQVLDRFRRARVRTTAGQAAMGSLSDLVAALGFGLVLVFAGRQIIAGAHTVGEFMTFFAALAFLFEPLRRLGGMSGVWQTVLASAERVHRLLAEKPTITQPAGPLVPLPAPGHEALRFEDVTFAYDGDPVLTGLSLTAEAGKTTALVGPSGAGKSTVFSLLTRLADPQQGRVTIDGRDIRAMDLVGLRRLFSVVAQDSALFDETLRDNIVMGDDSITEAQMMAVVRAAHVDEFLAQLAEGLDTRVGPRGSALSGGQRQRVAIARALLRQSPILLLDEATSALDARSEAMVQRALDELSAGRTTLVIAHRLSTVRNADKIIVMDAGRVIEEGTHQALMAAGGTYARLHAMQFAGKTA